MSRFMNRGSDDVRWCLAGKLNDVLAKIRFQGFNAFGFERCVQVNLFRRHAFAFDDESGRAVARDLLDEVVSFSRIARPMYPGSGVFRICRELCQILVEMKERFVFDAASLRSQIFPIVETAGSSEPPFAEK